MLISGLPSGLSLSLDEETGAMTGEISGTPDALSSGVNEQEFVVTYMVTDADQQTATIEFSITVSTS